MNERERCAQERQTGGCEGVQEEERRGDNGMLRMKLCKMRGVENDRHRQEERMKEIQKQGQRKTKSQEGDVRGEREEEKGTDTTSNTDAIITWKACNPNQIQ